jgi:hypothetical protein
MSTDTPLTPERLAEIESEIARVGLADRLHPLCASLRAAWAEREEKDAEIERLEYALMDYQTVEPYERGHQEGSDAACAVIAGRLKAEGYTGQALQGIDALALKSLETERDEATALASRLRAEVERLRTAPCHHDEAEAWRRAPLDHAHGVCDPGNCPLCAEIEP